MKQYIYIILISLVSVIRAQKPMNTSNPNDSWKLVKNLSDEFNEKTINWKKWYKNSYLPNTSGWLWNNEENTKIINGVAELTMRHNKNNLSEKSTYFKSGILKSKATFTTGYVEARIKGAIINVDGSKNGWGVCPSFWLYSNFDRDAANNETVYCEIDVVELQQFDWYKGHQDDIFDTDHNLHLVKKVNGKSVWFRPKKHSETQLNKHRLEKDPSRNYHIFGCEVNEKEIIWYVDGVKIASKPNTSWTRPMNVTMSLGLRRPFVKFFNNANRAVNPTEDKDAKKQLQGMPTTMYVDYVRVWTKK